MASYRLTKAADRDFESIFDFGIDQFGLLQAKAYQQGMIERFGQLAERPSLYPSVGHIRPGFHRSVYQSHAIYYRVEPDGVVIIRILGRQDADEAFMEEDEGGLY
ncbi:MAG: type II toxin-antitoxin system RelE/ParE family toxin [Deltaproteobacteria bacterium]|nr:type II toxin-antitoxin system RelE/ParE family toxin [Deltaproteobacteria bacterium]